MNNQELYDRLAKREIKPSDIEPYTGNNGRINKAINFIKRGDIRSGGVLLDVGGGTGNLGEAVRSFFTHTYVQDISWSNLDIAAAKENQVVCGDVDTRGLMVPSGFCSTVVALDLIEHIIDPDSFARECYRVLDDKGEVFINTPNIRFWRHIGSLLVNGIFPHTSGDREVFHGGHIAFFTFADLKIIFSAAGFKVFTRFKDEECYEKPPEYYINLLQPKTQEEYAQLHLEFGCPNLLFKASK